MLEYCLNRHEVSAMTRVWTHSIDLYAHALSDLLTTIQIMDCKRTLKMC